MDFNSSEPIYIQVIEEIKKRIVSGHYLSGEKLKSTRELALEYGINPNTAARIYKELVNEGVCEMQRGVGTFVTEDEKKISNIKKEMALNVIQSFIRDMKKIGYNYDEMIDYIKEMEEKENGNTEN